MQLTKISILLMLLTTWKMKIPFKPIVVQLMIAKEHLMIELFKQ